jgi:hypothetical protein
MTDPQVKGLPEGVEWVGNFLPPTENDFEMIRTVDLIPRNLIFKGTRAGAAAGVKVKPAEGYIFVLDGSNEELFDIREYKKLPGRPSYTPARIIPEKTVTVTATFKVSNTLDATKLEEAIKVLPGMPGYVSHEQKESYLDAEPSPAGDR